MGDGETWNYLDDFILMTVVDHLILLRSPISWWMAYLNPNKVIFNNQILICLSYSGNVSSNETPSSVIPPYVFF